MGSERAIVGGAHLPVRSPALWAGSFTIITDRYTGQSRGFGFVEMPDRRAAESAMQGLQGTALAGRALTLNEAKPREPRRETSRPRW